jgi:hypothetical protein
MPPELSPFASDFMLCRLYPVLVELGCDSSERDRLIKWFHKSASWDASDQEEFDAFAKAELRAKLRSDQGRSTVSRETQNVPDGSDEAQRQVLRGIVERERARKLEVARHNADVLASQPKTEPWTPCQHWKADGVTCPTCLKQVPPGVLARVQRMYESKVGEGGYRPFVLSCLDKEIPKRIGGRNARTYSGFADLENEVWQRVTKGIVDFEERPGLADGGIPAWLTAVVHSTVADHFKGEFREKRDIRKTIPLDGRAHDLVVPDSPVSPPDTATAVPVKPENDSRKVVFDGIGVPYFAK